MENKYDIRAEFFLSLLAEQDTDLFAKINLKLIGASKRRSNLDIVDIDIGYKDGNIEGLDLTLSRDGLFDTLPQRLLIPPIDRTDRDDSEVAEKITSQIENWRNFFAPFEQALFQVSTQLFPISDFKLPNILESLANFWGIHNMHQALDEATRKKLFLVLPLAAQAINDFHLAGLCFSAVLDHDVQLKLGPPPIFTIDEKGIPAIGDGALGRDFIIGNTFSDGIPSLQICIQSLEVSDLPDYLYKGKKRRIIEKILSPYFLPMDMQKNIILETDLNLDSRFKLSEVESTSILGYSTII